MTPTKRYAKKQAKARARRRHSAQERLERDQRHAQRAIEALAQALHDLGLSDNLIQEIEGRLRRQQQSLGKIFGCMFPSLFGCRTPSALCRVRGWEKHLPSQMLGARPKHSWLKRLRRLGLEGLEPLWRHVQDQSAATRSRWQWPWATDDAVCKKYGQQLDVVGAWWSGRAKRVRPGIDGVLLVVVLGEGKVVVPVDCAIRKPDPQGPGGPCRDKLRWVHVLLDACLSPLARRGLQLPPPVVVAESCLGDSKRMCHVRRQHQGTRFVEGKSAYVFMLTDGRRVKGADLLHGPDWAWRPPPWEPHGRSTRLRAQSPTYGAVAIVMVDEPGQDRLYLICLATALSAPQLIRRWRRRTWIAYGFRTLKHLLATEAGQVHSEEAYYGHLVLRLMGCFILFSTTRVICKGQMTMEETVFSLKHYGRFVDSEPLEFQGLSRSTEQNVA